MLDSSRAAPLVPAMVALLGSASAAGGFAAGRALLNLAAASPGNAADVVATVARGLALEDERSARQCGRLLWDLCFR
jgi:hypothetical protein